MFFTRFWRAIKMGLRMVKNTLLRPFRALFFQLQRSLSLSRQAVKMAPKVAKSITKVKLKPESRSDYIETKGAFIAKPLFILIIVLILGIGLLGYFVLWPWFESNFLVAHIAMSEERAATHSGRVVLYYDDEKQMPFYEGRLADGVRYGESKEYAENGNLLYDGDMEDGLYSGKGRLYEENGNILYEGSFREGLYEGQGDLYENGVIAYQGGFVQGEKSGTAKVYENGLLVYEGAYSQDAYNGSGKLYHANGRLKAEGSFSAGRMSGQGIEYYESGAIAYQGMFDLGVYGGNGVAYHENGAIRYKGGFSLGAYEGEGTLCDEAGGTIYKGGFAMGLYEGEGTLYRPDGTKHIAGTFEAGEPVGEIELYDEAGILLYEGGYQNGLYQGEGKLYESPGRRLEGVFEAGEAVGSVRLYVNNLLYYEGGYAKGALNGAGKLYNTLGAVIFEGTFVMGLPDGRSLLEQDAEAIYAFFGEGNYQTIEQKEGILILAPAAKMAAFVNYPIPAAGSETPAEPAPAEGAEEGAEAGAEAGAAPAEIEYETPSQVHRFYCFDPALIGGYTLATLPLPEEGQTLALGTGNMPGYAGCPTLSGTGLARGGYTAEGYYFTAWASNAAGPVLAVEFKSDVPLPLPATIPAPAQGA